MELAEVYGIAIKNNLERERDERRDETFNISLWGFSVIDTTYVKTLNYHVYLKTMHKINNQMNNSITLCS